jgi:hypothetical protein
MKKGKQTEQHASEAEYNQEQADFSSFLMI